VQGQRAQLGTPIAAEALPRLFDRFYRGERGRHEGAGLGLAITRAIAQAHGGSVSVASDDTGTVFELVLPAQQPGSAGRGRQPWTTLRRPARH
jgi:signal transduction histidine kinase